MREAIRDLRVLWATRKSSGFPWPFQGVRRGVGGWRGSLHVAVFGCPPYAAISLRRKLLRIPGRPWRYARMVRGIARTRNFPFTPSQYDSVP